MKPIITLSLISSVLYSVSTAATTSDVFFVGTQIPDNSAIGLSDTRHVTSNITSISDLTITIILSDGWTGDLYAYLTHGTGFSVLLNRPGRTLANLSGSGVSQLTATFSDTALSDIHTALPNSGSVLGIFQPDARTIDPDLSLNTSPRTAFLSSFTGQDANGTWTLFIADLATGDTMTLESWSLNITGVPEPSSSAILAAIGMIGLFLRRRNRV